jgi:hypothetical protein
VSTHAKLAKELIVATENETPQRTSCLLSTEERGLGCTPIQMALDAVPDTISSDKLTSCIGKLKVEAKRSNNEDK